jgi:glycerate-2-kinase
VGYIKNFDTLALSNPRKVVLQLIEEAFTSIVPKNVMQSHFRLEESTLSIQDKKYDLSHYKRVFIVGFGKGSSGICKFIEEILGERLTAGWDIDVVDESFQKIKYTKGTHPLPSQTNVTYTEEVLSSLQNLTEEDLVIIVVCGGGSALFEAPVIPLARLEAVGKELLNSGANISEMNIVRKHLSKVKGGGLAEKLYPAKIVGLMFSDVPGNDMMVIASGPTVMDTTTKSHVKEVVEKYALKSVTEEDLIETPTDEKYFKNVDNMIMVSNKTALDAMYTKAKELGYKATILTDRLQGDAKQIGKVLLSETRDNEILLAGGETTVKVTGTGKGGRNQMVVLGALQFIHEKDVVVAFDSDGWDYTTFAGAIGDTKTVEKAKEEGLEIKAFLDNDDSTTFFEKIGDGIDTGKLESNVSDLFIVAKI